MNLELTRRQGLGALVGAGAWATASHAGARAAEEGWLAAWSSSQQIPEPHNALPVADLRDATLRQVVRLAASGTGLRIRLSNVFGVEPLRIGGASVGRPASPGSSRLVEGSVQRLRFLGRETVVIPAGAEYLSDPVEAPVEVFDDLAVSLHLMEAPTQQTSHPGSRATTFVARGARTEALDLPEAATIAHWYFLSGVEVRGGKQTRALALLGDSITDGYGVQPETNQRWSDFLIRRLQADPDWRHLSVLNLGTGGNRLLLDGLGPNAAARFDRDVLGQAGVGQVLILEGVNDLGNLTKEGPVSRADHDALVAGMLLAYSQMAGRAWGRGLHVIGATILPFGGSSLYRPGPETEADRQAVNAWIRDSGVFDQVVDFDAIMKDPSRPDRLRSELDCGDGLHPSIGGYRAMAEALPLSVLRR